jgi:hypothetical protein
VYLQLLLCEERQAAAQSGTCDGSRLYPAPSWDENPDELRGPPVPDPGPLHTQKTPRAGGGEMCSRAKGSRLTASSGSGHFGRNVIESLLLRRFR